MIEIPFVLMAGVLGSAHCVGMCGGFVLSLGGSAPSMAANLRRQAVYSVGRIFTYATLGAVAGFGGMRLADVGSTLVNVPALLATLAGALLIYQGLATAGVLGRQGAAAGSPPCLAGSLFASLLTAPGLSGALLAGVFTGFLPCGLLYGMLALAASSGSLFLGMGLMALFGAGTVPVMVLTGASGSLLTIAARRQLYRLAAWCVVLTGVITLARGLGFITLWTPAGGDCPLCI